jgi:hypothetical protein
MSMVVKKQHLLPSPNRQPSPSTLAVANMSIMVMVAIAPIYQPQQQAAVAQLLTHGSQEMELVQP